MTSPGDFAATSGPALQGKRVELYDGGDPSLSSAELLSRCNARLWWAYQRGDTRALSVAMLELSRGLDALRVMSSPEQWQAVRAQCRRHTLNGLLRRDPLIRWSQDNAGGNLSQPTLLDFICRTRPTTQERTQLDGAALRLNLTTTGMPFARALRRRRHSLASLIDSVAVPTGKARILCVGAGHARELALSVAARNGAIARFVAFDPNREALQVLRRDHPRVPIELVCKPLRWLLVGNQGLGSFDLIYGAGLYDQLSGGLARILTTMLCGWLVPGGLLVGSNMMHGSLERGFVEAILDLQIQYRSARELEAATGDLMSDIVESVTVTLDQTGHVGYLSLVRA